MNALSRFAPTFLCLALFSTAPAHGQTAKGDPFEEGMRQAFADYKKGDNEAVTAKLRELLKLMEEKGAAKVGELLPAELAGWKGESLKQDDMSAVGGGVAMSRLYALGGKQITVKVVKDSPLVKQLIPLLANQDLIQLSNRKTARISGETAVMDGEHKLQMVVDGRIYVEFAGDDQTGEKELTGLARKLDLNALGKMK